MGIHEWQQAKEARTKSLLSAETVANIVDSVMANAVSYLLDGQNLVRDDTVR